MLEPYYTTIQEYIAKTKSIVMERLEPDGLVFPGHGLDLEGAVATTYYISSLMIHFEHRSYQEDAVDRVRAAQNDVKTMNRRRWRYIRRLKKREEDILEADRRELEFREIAMGKVLEDQAVRNLDRERLKAVEAEEHQDSQTATKVEGCEVQDGGNEETSTVTTGVSKMSVTDGMVVQ